MACSSSDKNDSHFNDTNIQYAPMDAGDNDAAEDIINDVNSPEDTEESGDIPLPFDVGSEADLTEADPDVQNKTPDSFTSCPTLGVSPYWEGTFEGVVTYNLKGDDPMQGLFLVAGNLQFQIKCLDQKLLISGALDGIAEAAGEVGKHPYAANLFGDFNYIERTVKADLLDGEVRLFKVISVFFEGNFNGAVQPDGLFKGDWDASHTGNDLNIEGESSGYGTWVAYPAPPPEEDE